MTQAEKLEALVRKAIGSGYAHAPIGISATETAPAVFHSCDDNAVLWSAGKYERLFTQDINRLIFDHDFARALFGEKYHEAWEDEDSGHYQCTNCGCYGDPDVEYCYEYHLQQAVISDDPIGYMYEAVFEK